MTEERWLPVVGYEGVYEISSVGRLKRVGRAVGATVGRIIKGSRCGGRGRTQCKTVRAHVLVFEAFNGPIPEGKEINHKDTDKGNNTPDNLEAITHKENVSHAIAAGIAGGCAEKSHAAKLTWPQVDQIKLAYKRGIHGYIRTGKLFGISPHAVWDIVNGRRWLEAHR